MRLGTIRFRCSGGLLAAALGAWPPPARAAEPLSPPPAKSHVLFMGVHLDVLQGKKFYRADDMDGSEFVVHVGGKAVFVPTRLQSNNVKMNHELKLSAMTARLDELEGGPAYTHQLARTYYAKISKDGVLIAAYADEACHLLVDDPTIAAVLADVLYKPSLIMGKPAEGVARVRLADLAL